VTATGPSGSSGDVGRSALYRGGLGSLSQAAGVARLPASVLDESQLDPDVMPINTLLRAAKELADPVLAPTRELRYVSDRHAKIMYSGQARS
jgi:hypothetical protein